jgi:hypothetical protein
MVPISRGKQVAGMVGALALGYSLSWLVMPGPGTGPVEHFSPTFGQPAAPVIVTPSSPRDERPVDASQPLNVAPAPLKSPRYEPI